MESVHVPEELKSCDQGALQAYCSACILQFMSQPALASTLGIPCSTLQQAALRHLIPTTASPHKRPVTSATPPYVQRSSAGPPTEFEGGIGHDQSVPDAPTAPAQEAPPATQIITNNTTHMPSSGAPPMVFGEQQHSALPPTPFIATVAPRADFILDFRHDCLNLGCAEQQCQLCSHAQARRCTKTFSSKYLMGDNLKASCGAAIRVVALDRESGLPLSTDLTSKIKLEIVLLNAKAVNFTKQGGSVLSPAELNAAMVPTHQGRPLLQSAFEGQDHASLCCEYDKEGRAVLPFRGAEVLLSGLMVTGSSEAILTGQRPQFVLLARAIDASSGTAIPYVPPLFSEGFVVATARVRTAVKKDIPHCNDPVSKLNALGKATQEKLRDLRQAAIDSGYEDMDLPLRSVTTVAEFRQLVEWAMQSKERIKALKKLLKLTRGWDEAVEHAATAVEDDTLLRAWWGGGQGAPALVFAANRGMPILDGGPVAILEPAQATTGFASLRPLRHPSMLNPTTTNTPTHPRTTSHAGGGNFDISRADNGTGGTSPPATSPITHIGIFPPPQDIAAATASWFQRLHPGWARIPVATESLQQHMSMSPSVPFMLPSTVMALCHKPQIPALGSFSTLNNRITMPMSEATGAKIGGQLPSSSSPSGSGAGQLPPASSVDGLLGQEPSLSIYATDRNLGTIPSPGTQQQQQQQPLKSTELLPPRSSPSPQAALPATIGICTAPPTTAIAIATTAGISTDIPPLSTDLPPLPSLLERSLTHRLSTASDFAALFGGNFPFPTSAAGGAINTINGGNVNVSQGMMMSHQMSHPSGSGSGCGWEGFPGVPPPSLLARMLSSIPGEDEHAGGGVPLLSQLSERRDSQSPSEMLDSLLAGLQDGPATSSLFRGLTPDWGKLTSLSPSEWQQLLQLAEQPSAWDIPGTTAPPPLAAGGAPPENQQQPLSGRIVEEGVSQHRSNPTKEKERETGKEESQNGDIDVSVVPRQSVNVGITRPPVVTVAVEVPKNGGHGTDGDGNILNTNNNEADVLLRGNNSGKVLDSTTDCTIRGIEGRKKFEEGEEREPKRRCIAGSGYGL